jgi:hypothetical protein
MPHAAFTVATPADAHGCQTSRQPQARPGAPLRRPRPRQLPPPRPGGGITAAEDRAPRHTVAASLARWRAAIAEARAGLGASHAAGLRAPPTAGRKGHRRPARPLHSNNSELIP